MPKKSPFPPQPHGRGAKPQKPPGGGYWLYGAHPVAQALANPHRTVLRLVATESGSAKLPPSLYHKKRLALEGVESGFFTTILPPDATHQGIAALVKPLSEQTLDGLLRQAPARPLVMLDQVTDPHNVGAILRSAAAFDAAGVIVTRHHAPEESGVLAKSASGALDIVPYMQVANLVQAMELAKKAGYWCIGLDGGAAQEIGAARLDTKTLLVMGAEGSGMRRLTAEHCDLCVRLPIARAMESLNVSNAAAIALYELSRQGALAQGR